MTIGQIAIAFTVLVLILLTGILISGGVYLLYSLLRTLQRTEKALREAALGDLSKLLSGQLEASKALVEAVVSFEATAKEYSALMSGMVAGPPSESLRSGSPDLADKEYEIQQLVRNGMSREMAEERVDDQRLYRNFAVER